MKNAETNNANLYCNLGRPDSMEWNGGMDWNSGMEWNGNKLDTSNWFSPPYRPPVNKDHPN